MTKTQLYYKKRINLESIIFIVFNVFVCSWYILPRMKMALNYTEFSVILLLYTLIYVIKYPLIRSLMLKVLFWSILLGAIHVFIAFPMNIKKGFWVIMTQYLTFIPFFIFVTIYARKNKIESIIIIFAILSMYIYAGLNTFIAMGNDPNIARFMTAIGVSDPEQVNLYQSLNIGGYGLSYSIGLLSVVLWAVLLNFKFKKSYKIVLLLFSVLFTIYVINAQFAILFIVTFILIAYVIFNKIKNRSIKVIALIALIPAVFLFPMLIQWLATQFAGTTLGTKFSSMLSADFFQTDRLLMYKNSFDLFLNSPLWGNDVTGANYNIYNASHSTFMSLLSSIGLLGISYYVISFFVVHKYLRIFFQKDIYNVVFVPSYIFLLIISLLNPTFETFEFYIVLFLFTPLVCKLYNKKYTINKLIKSSYVKRVEK